MTRTLLVFTVVIGLSVVACAGRPALAPDDAMMPTYPGELVSPDRLEIDFTLRQHVVAYQADEVVGSFEAVLEKVDDTLTLVALSPATGEAFVLTQVGVDATCNARVEIELPFPPDFILIDVNRAFLMSIAGTSLPDGEHLEESGDEQITESWHAGRLTERTFRRLDGVPEGEITIRYVGGFSNTSMPTEIVLANGWFGYRLEIQTLSFEYLEPSQTSPDVD